VDRVTTKNDNCTAEHDLYLRITVTAAMETASVAELQLRTTAERHNYTQQHSNSVVTIVVPYGLTNFTIGGKFRNFMELYNAHAWNFTKL